MGSRSWQAKARLMMTWPPEKKLSAWDDMCRWAMGDFGPEFPTIADDHARHMTADLMLSFLNSVPEAPQREAGVRDSYRCRDCGAHGVQLWRVGGSSCIELRCRVCGERHEGGANREGDHLGNLVPAVYDDQAEGDEWYGFTSVPRDRVEWWDALPERGRNWPAAPLHPLTCGLGGKCKAPTAWMRDGTVEQGDCECGRSRKDNADDPMMGVPQNREGGNG